MQNPQHRALQKIDPQAQQQAGQGQMVWIPPGYEVVTEPPAQEKESHLWDHIWLVWRGRWLIALAFLFCVGIATVTMLRATPIYEGGAKLHIGSQFPKIVDMGESEALVSRDFIDTQIQIVKSRTLARQVVEEFNLYAPEEEEEGQDGGFLRAVFAAPAAYVKSYLQSDADNAGAAPEDAAEAEMAARVNRFMQALSVSKIRDTEVVEIKFRDPGPAVTAQVANGVCDAYTRWNYQTKTDSYEYASKWIDQKLYEVKANLETSEENIYKFTGGEEVLALAENMEGFTLNLEETGQRVSEAESDLHAKQFLLESVRKGARPEDILDDPRLKDLEAALAEREVAYDEAVQQFGPEMREVKVLKAAKGRLELQIAEERTRLAAEREDRAGLDLATAQFEHDQAQSRRDFLQTSYAAQKDRLLKIQQRLIKYNILKREVDVNTNLYNSLLQRSREVGVTSGLKAGNVSVVEVAERPLRPTLPNKKRTVLLGAFLGVFLGIGLVFFREYMDVTVRGSQDLEQVVQTATLGLLPHVNSHYTKGSEKTRPEVMTAKKPSSTFAESVRHLRTSVQYSLAGHSPRTILVTSALPSEGKTTVASNLAISFAQNGQRTILIDADLKKPGIHKLWEIDRDNGLSEILTGKISGKLNGTVVKTDTDNLYVLSSGARPPNPVDLLDSDTMRRLLAALEQKFDHVIIDSAPTLDLADTGVLFPYVDGVVLVVKPGKTPRAALTKVTEKVRALNGRLLGAVLNDRRGRSSARYGYGYGYGYGDGYGYGSQYGEQTAPKN